MYLTVSFSFDTMTEKEKFERYAQKKGMKLSAMAKMATYQYRAKYPQKRGKKDRVAKRHGGMPIAPKTVQPQHVGGNGDDGRESKNDLGDH
jgi:hypothetical protein